MKMTRAVVAFSLPLTLSACATQSPMIGLWQNPGDCQYFPAYVRVSATDKDHIGFAMYDDPNSYDPARGPQLVAPMPAPSDTDKVNFSNEFFSLIGPDTLNFVAKGPDAVGTCNFTRDKKAAQ
jgi:hypothetical protein